MTTFNLGVALSKLGKKVLLVDTDPQGDLTLCMGYYDQEDLPSIANLMEQSISDKNVDVDGVILVPRKLLMQIVEY